MCHSVFHLDLPHLPSLPWVLPHPTHPHLLPAKCQHPQLKLTLPAATLPTLIHVEHHRTNGSSIYPTPPFQQTIVLITKRSQFCHHSQVPPLEAYITATELASTKLPNQEVEEFRSDVNRLLKQQQHQHHKQCNLTHAQCRALTQLKEDNNRVILTADKGWPWLSWTNRTTVTRHKLFYKTPTHTKFFQRTPHHN